MSMLGKLVAIEWIKIRKRSVFWVAVVVHATVIGIALGVQQYGHHIDPKSKAFTLPDGWLMLISMAAQLGQLMMFIAIALLTASETVWRTQRQNVIDGLSRAQYFSAKLIVVAMLAIIMWIDIPLMGMIMASLGGHGAITMPILSPIAQKMLPNALLYFAAIGATAFLIGMLASSSGAALGLLFAFLIIEPMVGGIMTVKAGHWASISRFLPLTVFGNLVQRATYDDAARASMAQFYTKLGRPLPISLQTSMITTVIYTIVFIMIAWMAFRKRDL